MRKVVVLGVGMTDFGRFPEIPFPKIGADAIIDALQNAGLEWKDILIMYCANTANGGCVGELVEAEIGHTGIPVINVDNACAGGQTTFLMAYQAVAGGTYDIALAIGVEQMPRGPLAGLQPTPENLMGIENMVSKYAMKMQRAIYEHRYTLNQMALVSVKNHKNGCYNPHSQYKLALTLEDVHNSRMISDPLTLYHCCPTGDGAATAILCTEEIARKHATPPFITVAGGALRSQTFVRGEANESRLISVNTANEAYEIAGIGPEDLDMVELHDNFTISELEHIVDLGLCEEDEVGRLMEEGAFDLTGRIPVSMSGGLLAKGHPTSATGVAQICELVWQMRGQAGQRQGKDPKVSLSHCCGGNFGMVCGVNILKK
ncbi:thiolase family protein [Chloroflexota bacterium]